MQTDAFKTIVKQMARATSFQDVFGKLSGDHFSRRRQLRKQFAYLAQTIHPDHVDEVHRTEAAVAFQKLTELRSKADEAIGQNAYEKPFTSVAPASTHTVEISSKSRSYLLDGHAFKEGDFSVLYRGTCAEGEIIAKIAREPSDNAWLEREAQILLKMKTPDPRDPEHPLKPYMPQLLESFFVKEGGRQFRVNIMRHVPDMVSVADIIEAFPNGLEPPQAAWVSRRVIAQAIAADMLGLVHGALTPDHTLVDPYKHEPLHIGWAHALSDPRATKARITHVVDRWRDIYAPEVFDKKTPDHRTDIYMAGATLVRLLGGDVHKHSLPKAVPDAMAAVTLRAIEKSPAKRFQTGAEFLEEYTRTVRGIWGRVYRPLAMPIR